MSPSTPLVFNGVTPQQYACLAQKATANGIAISGDSGTASKFGVEVSWNYVPAAQQLTIQVLQTPFFVSADDVNSKIQSIVAECAG